MQFYHVTSLKNLANIKKQGLIPKKDKRGLGFEDSKPGIYLFNSKAEASDGVMNWLGDCFDDDEELVLLTLEISSDLVEPDPELDLSAVICFHPIAASCIIDIEENF